MRLIIKSLNGKNCLLDIDCSSVADIARCTMDFVSTQLSVFPSAEFIKFSVVVKREVKQDEIAFDFSPDIISFD